MKKILMTVMLCTLFTSAYALPSLPCSLRDSLACKDIKVYKGDKEAGCAAESSNCRWRFCVTQCTTAEKCPGPNEEISKLCQDCVGFTLLEPKFKRMYETCYADHLNNQSLQAKLTPKEQTKFLSDFESNLKRLQKLKESLTPKGKVLSPKDKEKLSTEYEKLQDSTAKKEQFATAKGLATEIAALKAKYTI